MNDVAPSPPDHSPAVDAEHPWPGLVAFTELSSGFFFGREEELEELYRRIRREVAALFFGRSGLGKSSLLQAGLCPRLRQNGLLPILIRLDYSPEALSLSDQVKALFNVAMAEAGIDLPPLGADETFWERLHSSERHLVDAKGEAVIPVLIFDQFEEVFTLGLGRSENRASAQAFLGELADLIENRCPAEVKERLERDPDLVEQYAFSREDYRIVIALREDYLPALETIRSRAPSLGRNRMRLLTLNGRQAFEAIIGPGRRLVTDDLARQIVSVIGRKRPDDPFATTDVTPERALEEIDVEPALLSLFCLELNQRRLEAGLEEITPELVSGGEKTILDSFYERALADQPPALRDFIESELVLDSGVRENVSLERARRMLQAQGVQPGALDHLVNDRILHVIDRPEGPRIELIHDVLTDVVQRSRLVRSEREAAAAAAEHARLEAEDAARREAKVRETYTRRLRLLAGAALAVIAVIAVALVYSQRQEQTAKASKAFSDALLTANACFAPASEGPDSLPSGAGPIPSRSAGSDLLGSVVRAPSKRDCDAALPQLARLAVGRDVASAMRAFTIIGLAAESIGEHDPARGVVLIDSALAILQSRDAKEDPQIDRLVAAALTDKAGFLSDVNQPALALKAQMQAVALVDQPVHARDPEYLRASGRMHALLGVYLQANNDNDGAEQHYLRALNQREQLARSISSSDPEKSDAYMRDLADNQMDLGRLILKDPRRRTEALNYFNVCSDNMQKLVRQRPSDANRIALGLCDKYLGDGYITSKDIKKGFAPLDRAIHQFKLVYDNTPGDRRNFDMLSSELSTITAAYSSLAEAAKPVDRHWLKQSLLYRSQEVDLLSDAYRRLGDTAVRDQLVSVLANRAWALLLDNQPEAALADAQRALKLDPSKSGNAAVNEGHADLFLGRFDQAKSAYMRGLYEPGSRAEKLAVILADFRTFRECHMAPPGLDRMQATLAGALKVGDGASRRPTPFRSRPNAAAYRRYRQARPARRRGRRSLGAGPGVRSPRRALSRYAEDLADGAGPRRRHGGG